MRDKEDYLEDFSSRICVVDDMPMEILKMHLYMFDEDEMKQHDKELVARVLKEVEENFTKYLPLKNRTGAWFYGRLNEILKKYQKEFEDE